MQTTTQPAVAALTNPSMKKRHLLLGLLMLLSIITYMDRVCISVAGPSIQQALGLSPSSWGWVSGVFILAYGLGSMPLGFLGDRLGQRKVLAQVAIWWSTFTALTGVATSYAMMLVTQCLFGAGEAGAYPNISGSVARWFPTVERARAQGCVWAASRVGGALAPWLVVPLIARFGWRAPFLVFSGMGLAWAIVWYFWYRDHPSLKAGITVEELKEIGGTPTSSAAKSVPWTRLVRSGQLWRIMGMYWCYVWGSMFYLAWLHTYLVRGRGFTDAEMRNFSALPFLMGIIGNLSGGWLGDRLVRKLGLSLGRRLIGSVALTLTSFLFLAIALTHGKVSAIVLLSIGFGVMDCMLPSAWAICADVGGPYAGAVSGAMNMAGSLGGFFCVVLFGYLAEGFGNYNAPLFVIAGMVLISAIIFWRLDPTRPLLPEMAAARPQEKIQY